jgi:hypothetical protein
MHDNNNNNDKSLRVVKIKKIEKKKKNNIYKFKKMFKGEILAKNRVESIKQKKREEK